MANCAAPTAPLVVLDTNTVLDWLVFNDPGTAALCAAVESSAVVWLACDATRGELARALGYAKIAKWTPDSERVLATFDRWALMSPAPEPSPLNLRCADADDQVFIDLAVASRAQWLVTHDRAVLRLAKRLQALGVKLVRPKDWQQE